MLSEHGSDLMIVPSSENDAFSKKVCACLGIIPSGLAAETFKDGEFYRRALESSRGKDVFIVQSYFGNPNDRQKELELILDSMAGSAERITVVTPYHPYSRGDWKAKRGDAISARPFVNSLVANGTNGVLTMSIHSPQIAGFYPSNVDFVPLDAKLVFGYDINRTNPENDVILVSPDVGFVKELEVLTEELGYPMAAIYKRRTGKDETEAKDVMGDVEGKHCILFDDEISSGSSLIEGKAILERRGAASVRAYVTHNKLNSEENLQRLSDSGLELVCSDTVVPILPTGGSPIRTISVAPMFAEAIERIHTGKSTGDLFKYNHVTALYDGIREAGENIKPLYE